MFTSTTRLFYLIFFSNYTTENRVTSCGFNKWMHFFPHFDALRMISSGIGHMVLSLFRQSLYSRVRENSYKHVSSPYSCNSVISAPGNIFQHQLVKQFQISNANSSLFIQFHTPPPFKALPPSFHPSLCPSSDPISQWNHQELIPISALAGGPKQCMARLNSAVNSQPFPQRPSLSSCAGSPSLPGLHLCLF